MNSISSFQFLTLVSLINKQKAPRAPSESLESEIAILNAQVLQLEESLEVAYSKLEAQATHAARRERELTAAAKSVIIFKKILSFLFL